MHTVKPGILLKARFLFGHCEIVLQKTGYLNKETMHSATSISTCVVEEICKKSAVETDPCSLDKIWFCCHGHRKERQDNSRNSISKPKDQQNEESVKEQARQRAGNEQARSGRGAGKVQATSRRVAGEGQARSRPGAGNGQASDRRWQAMSSVRYFNHFSLVLPRNATS